MTPNHIALGQNYKTHKYEALVYVGGEPVAKLTAAVPCELGKLLQASMYAALPLTHWGTKTPVYPAAGITLTQMVMAVFNETN